jgi:hypothetical protein
MAMSGDLHTVHILSLQEIVAEFRYTMASILRPSTLADIIELTPILTDQLNDFFNGVIPEEMKVDSTARILSNYNVPTDVAESLIESMQTIIARHISLGCGGVNENNRYDFYIKNETTLVVRDYGDRRLEEYYAMKRREAERQLNHGDTMDSLLAVGP